VNTPRRVTRFEDTLREREAEQSGLLDAVERLNETIERLRGERDRLAERLTLQHGLSLSMIPLDRQNIYRERYEALCSLPVREDAPQAAEAGGGKSRRSGEGPH
jgi:hypothetical protein